MPTRGGRCWPLISLQDNRVGLSYKGGPYIMLRSDWGNRLGDLSAEIQVGITWETLPSADFHLQLLLLNWSLRLTPNSSYSGKQPTLRTVVEFREVLGGLGMLDAYLDWVVIFGRKSIQTLHDFKQARSMKNPGCLCCGQVTIHVSWCPISEGLWRPVFGGF